MRHHSRTTLSILAVFLTAVFLVGCPTDPTAILTKVTITPDKVTLEVDQTAELTAASTSALDTDFTWASSDEDIVAIQDTKSSAVTIIGVGVGTATITATGNVSGRSGTAVITVPEDTTGGGIPSGLLGPGLKVTITGVTIPADRKPEVAFTATDTAGHPVAKSELTDVRLILDYLEAPAKSAASPRYVSYTVNNAGQATQDSARLNGVTQLANGSFKYKFAAAIPANYNPSLTHQVGGQFQRMYVVDNKVYKANAVKVFRPDGGAVTQTREISSTQTCNACHTRMSFHGDIRREYQYCILCHNEQSVDPDTGNSVDMSVMVHKIHRGESLPSVEAGDPYQIIGFGGSVNDYSTVVFPQDIRNCTTCHTGGSKTDEDAYLTRPSRAVCGSCHDRVWFGNPDQTPEGFENHPLDFESPNDNQCAVCHPATGPGVAPIDEAHTVPTKSDEAPGLGLSITEVNPNPETGALNVKILIVDGQGNPVTNISAMSRLSVNVAYPATDYTNNLREQIWRSPNGSTAGTLASTTSPTGIYDYTFAGTLPVTDDTYAIALEGRRDFTFDGETEEQGTATNGLTFFTLDGSKAEPTPRREIVETAKCNVCHDEMRFHGGSRYGAEYCVFCHNTTLEDGDTGSSLNLKEMIHKIHMGEELENGFVIGSGDDTTDLGEARYPADKRNCLACHKTGTYLLPIAEEAAPTVINSDAGNKTVLPERAACTSCHDSLWVDVHAIINTNGDNSVESCRVCHGEGKDFAVSAAHAQLP